MALRAGTVFAESRRTIAAAAVLALVCGCARRGSADPAVDAAADAAAESAPASAAAARPVAPPAAAPEDGGSADRTTSSPPPGVRPVPASPVHALRTRVTRVEDDVALLANREVVHRQFGARLPREMEVQAVPLTHEGARALLVTDATRADADATPLVLVVDGGRGALRWVKHHPAGGIVAPIGPVAIASAPRGRVAFAVCDPPTRRVALRLWEDDGSAFADFDAMDVEDCTALSVLHWADHGWVIVASRPGATRAQLVTEQGRLEWGRGRELGARSRDGAVAALARDAEESFVLVQPGPASGEPAAAEHVLAFRYDARGVSLWPAPVDLGTAPGVTGAAARRLPVPVQRPTRSGRVRVVVGSTVVELGPNGERTALPR